MSEMRYEYIEAEQDGRVVTLTLRREAKLNAMNGVMMAELTDVFRSLGERPDVRAIVLTGTGKAFMAGADIEEYSGFDLGAFLRFRIRDARCTGRSRNARSRSSLR